MQPQYPLAIRVSTRSILTYLTHDMELFMILLRHKFECDFQINDNPL
jgi:hypothetical protein